MGGLSLREIAVVALLVACAFGAHVLVFYVLLRGMKAVWGRIKSIFAS